MTYFGHVEKYYPFGQRLYAVVEKIKTSLLILVKTKKYCFTYLYNIFKSHYFAAINIILLIYVISGILHVDYESLIPYLSESIKQNFRDINELKSNVNQVTLLIDMLYKEFITKDLRKNHHHEEPKPSKFSSPPPKKHFLTKKKRKWFIIGGTILAAALIGLAIGAYFIWSSMQPNDGGTDTPPSSLTPLTPRPDIPSPITVPTPLTPAATPPTAPPIDVYARERAAMEELYYATGGPSWPSNGGWLTDAPMCTWAGVGCDGNDRVISLQFTNPSMTGTLPASLGYFEMLTDLQFDGTSVGGTIPKIFDNLQNLKNLVLADNNFDGEFPVEIFNLKQLELVRVQNNAFLPWSLPDWIDNATSLMNLNLRSCNLVGTIPPALGTMNTTILISIFHNAVEGSLPSFKLSTKLISLRFFNTSLSGIIPEIPRTLSELRIAYSKLSGGLENLPNDWEAVWLDIQGNNFTGEFVLPEHPMTLMATLNIAYNDFTSAASYSSVGLSTCNVGYNRFACPLPSWMILSDCTGATCT